MVLVWIKNIYRWIFIIQKALKKYTKQIINICFRELSLEMEHYYAVFKQRQVGFTFQDVARDYTEKISFHLARIFADMVDEGMLCKITRDNSI